MLVTVTQYVLGADVGQAGYDPGGLSPRAAAAEVDVGPRWGVGETCGTRGTVLRYCSNVPHHKGTPYCTADAVVTAVHSHRLFLRGGVGESCGGP